MVKCSLISIIIPVYNSERWLESCIGSVLDQTYPNLEIIIVDDGSVDNSLTIANKFARDFQNIRVIHTDNRGVCSARNIGIGLANGNYLMFLDSDDMLTKDALEILYKEIVEYDSDIAIGWGNHMTSDGILLGCQYRRERDILCGTQALKYSLKDHPSMYSACGKLFKKESINNVRFAEGKKVNEDSFFVFQCLLNEPKVVICEHMILLYRINEKSASREIFSEKFFDILYFADQKYRIIEREYPQLMPLAENMMIKANMALLRILVKTRNKKIRPIEKKCIAAVIKKRKFFLDTVKDDRKWFYIVKTRGYFLYKYFYGIWHFLSRLYKK